MNVKALAFACCPDFLRPALDRIEKSPIGYRLAKGVFWSTAGAVISRALGLVAAVLVARMMGKTIYGEFGMIQSTVGMFGIFAGFGLGLTATKYVAEFRQSDPARAGRIIGLSGLFAMLTSGLIALGLFLFAPWLAEYTINAPHLTNALQIGAWILFLSGINGAQTGALAGFEAFKTIAYVNLFTGLISFPILIGGVYFGGLRGAIWALVISLFVNWLLSHLALRKEAHRFGIPFTLKHCGREWPVLWRFSLPAMLTGILSTPVTWACVALLVNQPNGYDEMGIFNAANQWFALVSFLPVLLGGVVLPVLSERLGQKDAEQSTRAMVLGIKVNALLVIPVVMLGSLASPQIMQLYGDGFGSGWLTLVVVLFTAGLMACELPITQLLPAGNKMWLGLGMNIVWALTFIVATFWFVKFGALGLATARAAAFVVQSVTIVAFAVWILREHRLNADKPAPSTQ